MKTFARIAVVLAAFVLLALANLLADFLGSIVSHAGLVAVITFFICAAGALERPLRLWGRAVKDIADMLEAIGLGILVCAAALFAVLLLMDVIGW
jgi:hypothetical protein